MTATEFLSRVIDVRKAAGGWSARCPAHEDRKASLSVAQADDRVLVNCHAGCTVEQIVGAVRLTLADLFTDACPPKDQPIDRRPATPVKTYDYVDEAGTLLSQVVRYDPKDFRQRRRDGHGGWTWSLGDVRRVLYRLPELIEQERVWFVEGEKDADALAALGLVASTSMGGADAWHRADYAAHLAALGVRELIIVPDHDASGEKYAATVAASVLAAGLRVKIIRLPDLPPKGDVSDWLAGGGTVALLEQIAEGVPWAAPAAIAARGPVHLSTVLDELMRDIEHGGTPRVATPFPSLNHFLGGGFAPGELIYLGARPGTGKTALGLEVARRAARNGCGVLVVSREMVNVALGRRLVAQSERIPAAALRSGRLEEPDRIMLHAALPKLRALPIWFADHLVSLRQITATVRGFADNPPLGLVIVDYLQLVRAPRKIRDRRHQVEAVSKGLKSLAVTYNLPVLCLSSLSRPEKGAPNRKPTLQDLRESGELEHDADVVLLLHRTAPKPETECIVAKNRDGRQGSAHLMFRSEFVAFDESATRDEE